MGFVGLILFIIINLWVFLLGVGYIKKCREPFNRRFLIFLIAGLLYWHGMAFFFDVLESPPTGIFLWILLGCIIGIIHADGSNGGGAGPRVRAFPGDEMGSGGKFEKRALFGIDYAIVDYELASEVIIEHAEAHRSFGVSALAVHGLVTSIKDKTVGERVKKIDMVVPDGQPVRWALNSFHKVGMKDRVYGPTLTLHVLEKASQKKLNVYLYGSTEDTLKRFSASIKKKYPGVNLCGIHPDRFRDATPEEDEADIQKINNAGAHIVLVGRGCPRQEVWVADHLGKVNAAMLAVGAAFDFHAGTLKQAPKWMQDRGLEWIYRLIKEPRRLWKRYLVTNSYFIFLYLKYKLFTNSPNAGARDPAVKSDA
jgi:exopolysaccharide biosynthesis WecB/TagA/CpsF family protein